MCVCDVFSPLLRRVTPAAERQNDDDGRRLQHGLHLLPGILAALSFFRSFRSFFLSRAPKKRVDALHIWDMNAGRASATATPAKYHVLLSPLFSPDGVEVRFFPGMLNPKHRPLE